MFDQILDLVGQPPGSLVYHFIILFAVEAALAMSVGQWMRERTQATGRLTLGILGVFLARALVLVASLLVWRGYLPTNVLLPPVERAVDTATVIALAWAFVTMDDPGILRRNFVPDAAAAALLGMLIAGFLGSYYTWFFSASRGQLFNGQVLDIAWGVSQIVIAAAGLIWMLTRARYVYDPFLKGMMLILLGAAAGIHLVNPVLGDIAAAVRVSQIVVMPMLTAVAYRHVVEQLLHWDEFEPSRLMEAPVMMAPAPIVEAPPPISTPPPAPVPAPEPLQETVRAPEPLAAKQKVSQPTVLEIVDAVGGLLSTLNQPDIVREAPRAVATALRADIVALAIVDEQTQQAGVVGGYDNISQTYLPQALLELSNHPGIVNALGRLRQIRLTRERDSRELRDLYVQLEISHEGPAYVQPLVNGDERLGVLIVGSPYSERQFSNEERNLLDRLAPLVTAALLNVEKHESLREQATHDLDQEASRLLTLSDDLTARTSDLNDARRQNEEMKAYIRDLHRQLDGVPQQQEASREQLQVLASELDEMRRSLAEATAEVSELRNKNEQLLQTALNARQGDTGRLEGLVAENVRLKQEAEKAASLEREIERLRHEGGGGGPVRSASEQVFFERQWEDSRLAAQAEIAALRARLAQASISQQEVGFLQEQLAIKARETIGLQARLTEATAIADALREQLSDGNLNPHGLETMQARVAAQAAQISGLKNQLAQVESARIDPEALQAEANMNQADRDAMNQLESQLRERTALVDSLEAQLAGKTRAITELRGHMAEVEASLQNLEKQFSRKTEEVTQLQNSLGDARMEAQKRIAALEASREEGAELDQMRVEVLEAELAERSAAIAVLEQQLQSSTEAMSALEQQLSDTRFAVDAAITDARQIDSHDEVIASIAQELRTPMSSIMGYTDLLLRESIGILGSLQRKFLQRVKANTERMGALLDDLIRITALDTGRLELEPEKIDVTYAVEEALMNVANQYREKGLVLRLALAEPLPPLTADRDAILQMIGHLLSNAALASPVEGEVELMVAARRDSVPHNGSDVETQCLYISVEDSGSGIAPDDFERVFARKYRADNPLIEGLGDTGVSLSLAKALVDAHGGRIWLDSNPESGTTFHVVLPLEPLLQETE